MEDLAMGQELTGTSIMAAKFNGGVILGADSRTTTGVYIAGRASDKIEPIHSRIFCLRSGVSSHTQALAHYVRHYSSQHAINEGMLPCVAVTARLFQQFIYSNKDMLTAAIIVAGWDPEAGPSVFELTLGGTMVESSYAMSGSGSGYIYGYCDANWKEGMTMEECKEFVKSALSLAMARDGSSGGIIRLAIVTQEDVVREYISQAGLPYRL